MKKETYINFIACSFIMLFLYAAVSKVTQYQNFEAQIGKSPLIMHYNTILAWLVPTLEIVIAVLLISSRTTLLGLYGSMIMMFIFTLYITFIMTLSPYVPCSCGGILDKMGWGEHLIFNIAFTLLAIVGIYLKSNAASQSPIIKTA